jgi:hypothetical protein
MGLMKPTIFNPWWPSFIVVTRPLVLSLRKVKASTMNSRSPKYFETLMVKPLCSTYQIGIFLLCVHVVSVQTKRIDSDKARQKGRPKKEISLDLVVVGQLSCARALSPTFFVMLLL